MEISIEELNTLLQQEFERGKSSVIHYNTYPYNPLYPYTWDTTPINTDCNVTCTKTDVNTNLTNKKDDLMFTC